MVIDITGIVMAMLCVIFILPLLAVLVASFKSGIKAKEIASQRKTGMSPSTAFWYVFIHDLATGIVFVNGSILLFMAMIYYTSRR